MSEEKMREALITAREVLRLEGYPDNNVAMVQIHSALALQPAAVVELTDLEIEAAAGDTLFEEELEMLHRVLAALRAKQGGVA